MDDKRAQNRAAQYITQTTVSLASFRRPSYQQLSYRQQAPAAHKNRITLTCVCVRSKGVLRASQPGQLERLALLGGGGCAGSILRMLFGRCHTAAHTYTHIMPKKKLHTDFLSEVADSAAATGDLVTPEPDPYFSLK